MRTSPPRTARAGFLAGTAALLLLTSCSGDGSEASTAEPSGTTRPSAGEEPSGSTAPSTSAPTTVKVPKQLRARARTGIDKWAEANLAALSNPKSVVNGKGPAGMAGNARRQTINQAVEYAQNDWHVEGRAKVISQRVIARTDTPPTLTLAACIDNADVQVIDGSGKPVGLDQGTPTRSLNLITLTKKSGTWLVTDTSFPDDPDC